MQLAQDHLDRGDLHERDHQRQEHARFPRSALRVGHFDDLEGVD